MATLTTRAVAFAQAITFGSLVAGFATFAAAGPFDAPAGYYSTATGTGTTLKSQLHDIIDDHTIRSYGDARTILQDTDADPDNPGRMLLVYDRTSLDVAAINPGGSIPGWDSGNSWNREHTWPRSRGVNSSGPDNSDL
ncbi:MAG: endonuclease, partial [Planctomycetota bacterium]